MAGVSVEVALIDSGISCCDIAVQDINTASQTLNSGYETAGADGWNDIKYRELGTLVGSCTKSLKSSVSQLEACKNSLQALKRAVMEYQSIHVR